MEKQRLFLLDWEWIGTVFYEVGPEDVPRVVAELKRIGCDKEHIQMAKRNLMSGEKNNGVTFSNPRTMESVIALGKTTSADEFMSSLVHEKGHLATHISQTLGISPMGEEFQYLSGEIARQMFMVARKYLCDCCRKKVNNDA